jgi:hypothetical protein
MSDPTKQFQRPPVPEPWAPAEATDRLRRIAVDESFTVSFKVHALEQMEARDITTPDVLHAMKTGFVYDPPFPAKQPGLYLYTIKGATPSSNRRDVRIVVIPSMHKAVAKIVTVMWADEPVVQG